EVVAVVGVTHDHEAATRRLDTADQGAAVTLPRDLDHPHPELLGDDLGAIGAAVVGDDDLRGKAVLLDRALCFLDASRQRLHLVQAGHDDRKLHRGWGSRLAVSASSLGDRHGRNSLTPATGLSLQKGRMEKKTPDRPTQG